MNRRSFTRSLAAVPMADAVSAEVKEPGLPRQTGLGGARTFSYAGKELRPFAKHAEATLVEQDGAGYLDHLWFGGDFPGYRRLRLRFYIDDGAVPSIDCELGMAAGVGFGDVSAPWGTQWGGITGAPSGIFLNYRVPFGKKLRITAQLPTGVARDTVLWWIARGLLDYQVEVSGIQLPATARLRLHRRENFRTEPLEHFDLCKVSGAGMVFQVFMAAQSTNFEYLEGQMRAYIGSEPSPQMLSSGLEDYFLGTYYFNRGLYHLPQAGLTHKDETSNSFSGYRFHDIDPVLFSGGLRLACRCGEMLGDKIAGPTGKPQPTVYTTYVWTYEWS